MMRAQGRSLAVDAEALAATGSTIPPGVGTFAPDRGSRWRSIRGSSIKEQTIVGTPFTYTLPQEGEVHTQIAPRTPSLSVDVDKSR
jgi:hypothetical protein